MSEKATILTQNLILEDLPKIFDNSLSSTERWVAVAELRAKTDDLVSKEMVDEPLIRALSIENADRLELDHEAADKVFDVVRKPAGGSLSAMHAPSHKVWIGTGSSVTTTSTGDIVHYINRPGEAEERYGPALPYVLDKLAWLAVTRGVKGYPQIHHGEGYKYVANRLNRIGRKGTKPHIGSLAVHADGTWGVESNIPVLLTSSSGTLPTPFHDHMYEAYMPSLKGRADRDRDAGLFDGWEANKRAGIYDIAFAEMIGKALYGVRLNDQMLSLFDIVNYFEDVDIN